jgi:hypothetical protein
MKKLSWPIFWLVFFSTLLSAKEYSLEDLKILAKNEGYQEFWEHMNDLAPTARNTEWRELVLSTAILYCAQLAQKKHLNRQYFKQTERLYDLSWLRENEIFKLRRRQVFLLYFKQCFDHHDKADSICYKDFDESWQNQGVDPEASYDLSLLIIPLLKRDQPEMSNPKHYFRSQLTPFRLLWPGLKSPSAQAICRQEILQDEIWNILWKKEIDSSVFFKQAHPSCLDSFASFLKMKLSPHSPIDESTLAFSLLKNSPHGLSNTERSFYLISIFLKAPPPGEILNLSWRQLDKIKTDAKNRFELLEKFKTVHPLPGDLFSLKDQRRSLVLTRHLAATFPEYLLLYAKKCLEFYEGKISFPNGSSTYFCRELFDMNKHLSSLIPQDWLNRFQMIK